MDIILTISLLASNRRESLVRCLDSLKPLLVKIPSELIIVFTGTDEKVLEIAQKYTPQVMTFEWCDDFSAARNIGLKAAQGEWFLYLDDDEWFDDVEEICQFFLSGEYRHYCCAHYIQRNYEDWNGTKYSDFSAFRMTRRYPGSCFYGAIHEELSPRIAPCKYFQTCVHHYGYVKNTENGNISKTSRNIPMLLRAIENQPKQVKNYIQLAKEFDLAGNWKAAEEYCRKGLSVCHESSDLYSTGWLKAYLSYLISKKPGNIPAISEIEMLLTQEPPTELIRLTLFQQLIHLCAEEKEPGKAVGYGHKFEKLLKKMDEDGKLWEQQTYGEFSEHYIKSSERLYNTRMDCAACAMEMQDWADALYFMKLFPWDTEDILQRYYSVFEKWRKTYNEPFTDLLLQILEDIMNDSGISLYFDVNEASGVSLPVYLLFQRALAYFNKGQKNEGLSLFTYCIMHTDNECLRQLLLKEAIYHQVSVIPLAAQMALDIWNELVGKVVKVLPFSLNDRLQVCVKEIETRYPLHSLCLEKQRLEQKLSKGFPLWDGLTEDLENYCICITEFYKGLYREDWLKKENSVFLPAEYRFARIALTALEALKQEEIPEAVRLFGDAFHINPDMSGVITELIRQTVRRLGDPALHGGTEFLQLASQMKEMLRTLLYANQTEQAAEILNQLLPIIPEDLELIWIRQEFIRRTRS